MNYTELKSLIEDECEDLNFRWTTVKFENIHSIQYSSKRSGKITYGYSLIDLKKLLKLMSK